MQKSIPFAATVVLLREGTGSGPEVFLMKRHGKSGFMGGVHVFPGGKLDDTDRDPGWAARTDAADFEASCRRCRGADPETLRALAVASIRETLEEAGVLIGTPVPPDISAVQQKLNAKELEFAAWAASAGVKLGVSKLVLFDHWITPEIEQKRFDTWFFAARVPEGQQATSLSRETTEGVWMRPGDAVERYQKGEITLAPPTCTTLIRLAKASSPDDALRRLSGRPIATMLPRLKNENGQMYLALPGHPSYGDHEGDLDPEGPACVKMVNGKWFPDMAR